MPACERKSESEMKEASKKATEEGMRAIAAALAEKIVENEYDADTESESDSASETDEDVRKLERRIHYMKLDMSNMQVRIHELEAYEKIVEQFGEIENLMRRMSNIVLKLKENDYASMKLRECNGIWSTANDTTLKVYEEVDKALAKSLPFPQLTYAMYMGFEKRKEEVIAEMDRLDDHITKEEVKTVVYYTVFAMVIWMCMVFLYAYSHILV